MEAVLVVLIVLLVSLWRHCINLSKCSVLPYPSGFAVFSLVQWIVVPDLRKSRTGRRKLNAGHSCGSGRPCHSSGAPGSRETCTGTARPAKWLLI
jgi:hypothetical protein